MKARYQKADVRGVGVSFVFIPMGQSPLQKIAPNVSRIKATIPMINNELKPLQSRRKRLIENISNIADEIAEIDKDLAIHRRVSRLNYTRRCAEASAVQAHMKQGIPLAPGMEISYVIRDASRWGLIQRELHLSSMLNTIEGCWRRLGVR